MDSLIFSLTPASHGDLWDFRHKRIDPLTRDQKVAARACLHWFYRNELQKGILCSEGELSLFAYWGFPAGSPSFQDYCRSLRYPTVEGRERELSVALPSVISGAQVSEDGEWSVDGENCRLIQRLLWGRFIHLDQREDGWIWLLRDPADGAYWECAYLHRGMEGDGPPTLTRLSVEDVRTRYDLPALSLPQAEPF